jgi:hypothetical protein
MGPEIPWSRCLKHFGSVLKLSTHGPKLTTSTDTGLEDDYKRKMLHRYCILETFGFWRRYLIYNNLLEIYASKMFISDENITDIEDLSFRLYLAFRKGDLQDLTSKQT